MLAARRSFVKIWLSNAAVAFEEKKIDFRTRSAHLEGFFRLPYYDDLTRELILNVSLLPNAFVHDVLDTSQDPAVVRLSLSLLQGHITVHNSFFATSAEPIHSNEDKAEEDPEPKLPVRDWGNEAPGDAEMFDKAKLSYIAIQVKNCIKRPSKAVRNGHHDQQQGHMYSQRQHPQPKTDTPLTQADQRARQLLRHHLYIAGQDGGTFPQLNWLLSPAKEQVALLFGCTVSVETVEFDQMQARYVRDQKSQSEQDTWDEAQVRIHGALVISGCLSAASLDPNVID
ncbi:hypothetical protein NDA14_004168 [Ustilago hordei]|nr:hypothetical protein NDA14_004168 [Ustilago hordei]